MKRWLVPLLILLVSMLVFLGVWAGVRTVYIGRTNQSMARLLHAVRSAYPEVTDEELLKVLAAEDPVEDPLPDRLSFDPSHPYDRSIASMDLAFLGALGGVLILEGLAFLLWQNYKARKDRRQIDDLITYTEHISQGVYDLRIQANDETELSRLTNALYKITVVLKESAEHSQEEALALSRSLADISHQIKTPLTSIRIMLDTTHTSERTGEGSDRKFYSFDMISLIVGRATDRIYPHSTETFGDTIWNNRLEEISREDYYQIGERNGKYSTWYGTKEEAIAQQDTHRDRYRASFEPGGHPLSDAAKEIVLPFVRRQPRCKTVKASEIESITKHHIESRTGKRYIKYTIKARGQVFNLS